MVKRKCLSYMASAALYWIFIFLFLICSASCILDATDNPQGSLVFMGFFLLANIFALCSVAFVPEREDEYLCKHKLRKRWDLLRWEHHWLINAEFERGKLLEFIRLCSCGEARNLAIRALDSFDQEYKDRCWRYLLDRKAFISEHPCCPPPPNLNASRQNLTLASV